MKRFWEKVDRSGDCWEWRAGATRGYGTFWDGHKMVYAHRFSFLLDRGFIPSDTCVLHNCDNPSCVNPEHLFLGTRKDNMQDSISKKRNSRGEVHGRSVLTKKDVYEIRRLHTLGVEQRILAKMWKIDPSNVSLIASKKRWAHI